MSATTAAPAVATTRTFNVGGTTARSIIGILSTIGLIVFVFFASQQVGMGEADIAAMFAVGGIAFTLFAALAVLIGVGVDMLNTWLNWVGIALIGVGFVLTLMLFTVWGGTDGTFGLGWYGIVIGALFLLVTTTIFLPAGTRRQ